MKFSDWLRRKKKLPVSVPRREEPAAPSHDDLDDAWQASADPAGLSGRERRRLISKSPPLSDERLKDIEDAWHGR